MRRRVSALAIATEIHVPWHVGDQGKSGLVVLNVCFVARDPKETSSCIPLSRNPVGPQSGGAPKAARRWSASAPSLARGATSFGTSVAGALLTAAQLG